MVISVILALHARSLNVPEFQEILIVFYRWNEKRVGCPLGGRRSSTPRSFLELSATEARVSGALVSLKSANFIKFSKLNLIHMWSIIKASRSDFPWGSPFFVFNWRRRHNREDISSVSATVHLHRKIGRKEIGRKEHDWSDDESDPMSQGGCIQCGTKQNR
jgi:hypothetical protein